MRVSGEDGPLRVQAIAGTHVVTLGFDHDRAEMPGVLGFAVERDDHTEDEHTWLPNMIRFSQARTHAGSNWNPFQTFTWGDYTAKPGYDYTYTVHTMTGEPGTELTPVSSVALDVRTEEPGEHGIWFNRGVYGSQAYANRFHNQHPRDVPDRAAWIWLSRGLEEALVAFIDGVPRDGGAIRGAFYEFEYPSVLDAFRRAANEGVDVRLVVDDETDNRTEVTKAGLADRVETWRAHAQIPHNKFAIALQDDVPLAVWTGSTNITENGIFGQSNVGHTVTDPTVAERYAAYWELLLADPTPGTLNDLVDVTTGPLPDPWPDGVSVVFSPRSTTEAQDRYAQLFSGAEHLLCMTFPFNLDGRFAALLPGAHDALRWLLFENRDTADVARLLVDDPGTELVYGAVLAPEALQGWVGERDNPLSSNVEYLHTKYLLQDPLGDDPIVVTGSANFSNPSANQNDENMLVIRGDHGVAEIYFTEFFRLFNHYRLRDRLGVPAGEPIPPPEIAAANAAPLTPAQWWDRYYDEPARDRQRRLLAGTP